MQSDYSGPVGLDSVFFRNKADRGLVAWIGKRRNVALKVHELLSAVNGGSWPNSSRFSCYPIMSQNAQADENATEDDLVCFIAIGGISCT